MNPDQAFEYLLSVSANGKVTVKRAKRWRENVDRIDVSIILKGRDKALTRNDATASKAVLKLADAAAGILLEGTA